MTSLNLNSIYSSARSVSGAIAGSVPKLTVRGERANKIITWIGKNISSPENRLILGASALMTQPFIDLSNKKVDKDTRETSAKRTVAKIIAGTLTGVFVRKGCIKAIDELSKLPSQISATTKYPKLRTLFTPDSAISGVLKDLTNYKRALGTIVSLVVMLFTNFLIDAPLTKFLTNKFIANKQKKSEIEAEKNKIEKSVKQIKAQQPQKAKEVANG